MNPVNYRLAPPARKSEICSPTHFARLLANQRFDRKPTVCLAKVVDFVANPPQLRPVLWTGPRPQEA